MMDYLPKTVFVQLNLSYHRPAKSSA